MALLMPMFLHNLVPITIFTLWTVQPQEVIPEEGGPKILGMFKPWLKLRLVFRDELGVDPSLYELVS